MQRLSLTECWRMMLRLATTFAPFSEASVELGEWSVTIAVGRAAVVAACSQCTVTAAAEGYFVSSAAVPVLDTRYIAAASLLDQSPWLAAQIH